MTGLKNLWKLRHSTLTNNIVVLLLVFGITPLAILFLVSQNVFIAHEKKSFELIQRDNAIRIAENISWYINQNLSRLKIVSEMWAGDLSDKNLNLRLNEFLIQHPEFDQITLLDSQGREISTSAQDYTYQAFELKNREADPNIQQSLSGKSLVIPLDSPPGSRHLNISLFLPIKDGTNVNGVLEARINLMPLRAIISKQNIGGNCYAFIIAPDGRLIADQDYLPKPMNEDTSRLPIVQAFAAGQTGVWDYRSLHNHQVIGASAVIPATGWGVIVEKSSIAAYGQIYRVATLFFGLFTFTLIAAVIRGLIFSQNRIIAPVKALQQEVESLSQGVFPQGLNVSDRDELGQLSQAFNQMVQHLKKTTVSRDLLAREVAERKLVEEALRHREATLRSIFITVPLGIGSLNQWTLVGGNDFFYKITGYPQEEILGKNLNCLFSNQNDYKKMVVQLRQTLGNKETVSMETQWRRRDGQVREIYLKIAASDQNDLEKDLVFAAMDISDLRKMERERLRIDKLESLGIMAGGIAHDFNNILTIIQGNIELVGLDMKNPHNSLGLLLEAEQACQRAQHLAKQLLTFAKGGLPIKKPVLVSKILHDAVPLALSGSNSAVEIFIEEDVWPIEVDEDQINQVINNILINADQAMPDGGQITIKVNNFFVTPATGLPLPNGNYVRFSFIDHGIGISQKELGKIFDPYFTTKQFGNGLGLTAAFSIVKNHQGHISVDSKIGQGSSFHLYLPAAKSAPQPISSKVSNLPIRGHGRILVMDDEASIRRVLGHMLNKLGYEAVCVEDGEHVLEAFQNAKKNNELFDAVILDLTIPGGLGGKETLELILQFDPHIQAIVSSGYGEDPIMANYEKFGFTSVIAKPYKISELSLVLHDVMSKKNGLSRKINYHCETTISQERQ